MSEIVILGGGVIGLCTAYYLLESDKLPHGSRVTIVENVSIAFGASSRAAGFIGGGDAWHKEANQQLARLSWDAFEKLSRKLDGSNSYGYRYCSVTGVVVGEGQNKMSSYRQLPTGVVASPSNRVPWYNGQSVNMDVSGRAAQLYVTTIGLLTVVTPKRSVNAFMPRLRSSVCAPSSRNLFDDEATS